MKQLLVLASLLLGILRCCVSVSLDDLYPFSAVLKTDANGDPLYTLHWNFSATDQTVTFGVNVSSNGWVGLGISPTGGMTNSDVAIGWVNDEGNVFFHDRFAFEQSRPPIDPQQDWFIISGENVDGYTILQFWREWVTCDERDRDIQADTSRVVFAWNNDDPAKDDPDSVVYHGENRDTTSINLLSGVTNPPVNEDPSLVQSFTLAVDNVAVPNDDTTYWCAALEFPQEIQQQKQYIIRFSPKITPNDFQYVHHMLIYLCRSLDETEVGTSAPCEGMVGETVSECRSGSLIAGWAVGGADFIYPENAAYPLGGPDSPRYVVIEIHYDNPLLHSGVMDSSGIEFFYVSQPRSQDAGIITLGHHVNNAMIVPPRTSKHDIYGKCSSVCTSKYLPPEGIKVFGNLLHTHLVGRGLTLRLIRNSTQCGGLEQLKPVDQNLQYDFNFQQFTVLPEEVTVYPGDILLLECNYDTSENEGVVLGGESTRQEMCLSFLAYYPRTPMSACYSTPTLESFYPFAGEFIPEEHRQTVFESILFNTTEVAEAVLNQYVEWTPEASNALQESVFRGDLISFCLSDQGNYTENTEEVLPDIQCPYKPPELCAAGATGLIINLMTVTVLIALNNLLLL